MKNTALIFILLGLVACSSHGPRQSKFGLLETEAFDPLFLASIAGKPNEKVLYKTAANMFIDEVPASLASITDTFVISDSGIYLVEWSYRSNTFKQKLKLEFGEIRDVKKSFFDQKPLGVELNYIEIKDVNDKSYKFQLFNGSESFAKEIIESKTSTNS